MPPENQLTKLRDIAVSKLKPSASRKEELRQRIAKAAAEVFMEKGYEKTTMRQIATKAGILNGSLYNAFACKEDVFDYIISKISATMGRVYSGIIDEGDDFLHAAVLPVSLEIFATYRDPRLAELFHEAYSSWPIVNRMVSRQADWFSSVSERSNVRIPLEGLYRKLLLISGAVGRMIDRQHFTGDGSLEEDISTYVLLVMTMLNIPTYGVRDLTDRIMGEFRQERFGRPLAIDWDIPVRI